ncbi:ankyrin repeat-containing protein [Fusarium flagelliforme]|uniref:phospholipase A2 n=1 Tax=Fusarium flagelliforme TaxID=2675880 RepID=A0A395MG84_9HYPO|nr:ankyrin repeat-containing protein [Fusarium flagelliforme]
MKDVVHRHAATEQLAEDLTLLEASDTAVCKVFVCTRNARAMNIPRLFRSYSSHNAGEYENAAIWQAGRATSAAPKFFKRLRIGQGILQEEFLDGGIGSNNPTKIMIDEVGSIYPERSISCIISIGTGRPDVTEVKAPSFFQRVIPMELIDALKDMATDCEAIALEMKNKFRECPNLYFRFNVEHGLEDIRLDNWQELGNIKAKTVQYLAEHKTKVNEAALALFRNEAQCSVKDLGPTAPQDHLSYRRRLNRAANECLKSLAFAQMDDRAKDIAAAADGTCDWLVQHCQYLAWTNSQGGLFWIQGKPGSGKSTLLRHFLDNIQIAPSIHDTDLVLSFFFHARGTELQQSSVGLYRSLLHQLLSQVPMAVGGLVSDFETWTNTKKKEDQEYDWKLPELQKWLERSLHNTLMKSPVWVFVDALDECGKENARQMIDYFSYLQQELGPTSSELHICFTCRHYPKLSEDINFQVCLEDENRDDISAWVKSKLPSDDLELISDLIIDQAAGVFMWARLVVERIRDLHINKYPESKMKETLAVIPKDLDALYLDLVRDIIESTDVQRKSDSLKLISWICFALRPISIHELSWVMAINDDCPYNSLAEFVDSGDVPNSHKMETRVLDLTSGLIEVTDALFFQFIHQSVSDFFLEKGLEKLNPGTSSLDEVAGTVNWQLFKTCICYLGIDDIDGINADDDIDDIDDIDPGKDYSGEGFPLLRYGFEDLLGLALTDQESFNPEVNERDEQGRTPLSYAAETGNEGILRLLLEHGADPALEDKQDQIPLSLAVMNEREAITEILLARDDAEIGWTDSSGRTLLWYAAGYGGISGDRRWGEWVSWYEKNSNGFPLLKLLIKKGDEIDLLNQWDSQGLSLLAYSVTERDLAVPRLLLEQGANVDLADVDGRTPLWNVIIRWCGEDRTMDSPLGDFKTNDDYSEILCLLLKFNADRESENNDRQTPLRYVAAKGNFRAVTVLLRMDAEINSVDQNGRTPLSWASGHGHRDIVQALCNKGARVELADTEGCTPLSWASKNGHKDVVQILIDEGVCIDSTDNTDRTALSWASQSGHQHVVRLLLIHSADSVLSDKQGWSPLWYAILGSHDSVIHLLLELGAVTWTDRSHWPILHHAATTCGNWVVGQLLDRGGDIESTDRQGRTCLLWAVQEGRENTVKFLRDRGASDKVRDEQGQSTLSWAARQGNLAMTKLLLKGNSEIDSVDDHGRTPLAWAAWKGHHKVVQLLVENGADRKYGDMQGRTPLWYSEWAGHEAVTQLLVEKGVSSI